jgi:hypothetical protein
VTVERWEEIGWIEVDAGGIAFCRDGVRPSEPHYGRKPVVEDGAVYQATMVDCALPVEIRRDVTGEIVAARLCFTTDVDVIDGTWTPVGHLDLPDGRCTACDPDCDADQYRFEIDTKAGEYLAEVFEFEYPDDRFVDILGLRITWVSQSTETAESSGL